MLQVNFYLYFLLLLLLVFGINEINKNDKEEYISEEMYPVQASDWLLSYIEENDISKEEFHLYNGYNYGSYLLYRGIPVFIDSRAEQPYSPEFNEGVTVFDDYMEVSNGRTSYSDLFEKYDINYAICYQASIENTYMKEDENCIELYSDENFIIYKIEN